MNAIFPVVLRLITLSDGLNYFLGAFVGKMTVNDQNGMNHTGYPEQQSQKDVQDELKWLAAKQNGKWRKDNGKKISHFDTFRHTNQKQTTWTLQENLFRVKRPQAK